MKEQIKNRNESYKKILKDLGFRQKVVYDLIDHYGGLTSYELSDKMVLVMGSITGRVKELEEMCLIKASGSRWNTKTKRKNTIWIVTSLNEFNALREAKINSLTEKAVHLAVDLGSVASETAIKLIADEIDRVNKKLQILI